MPTMLYCISHSDGLISLTRHKTTRQVHMYRILQLCLCNSVIMAPKKFWKM